MACRITINVPVEVLNRWFLPYQQYCYTSRQRSIVDCEICEGYHEVRNVWVYNVEIDGITYPIPETHCVYSGSDVIPADQQDLYQYRRERDKDTTTDYTKEVLELMGIDLRVNQISQHDSRGEQDFI